MSARTQVGVVLAGWVSALLILAALWVRSPWTGPGPMFLGWSAPAALLFGGTWTWLGRIGVTQVPRGRALLTTVALMWAAAAWLAASGIGTEMVLDADILRRPFERRVGVALEWLPGVFGLALSVAGLSAGLEARYRVSRR